jgi:hypothetical protein
LADGNGKTGWGVTGCGPTSDGSDYQQTTGCSQYYTTLGLLASSTLNAYGVYDMAGGAWEVVMANGYTGTNSVTNMVTYPNIRYVNRFGAGGMSLPNVLGTGSIGNTFGTKPSWGSSATANIEGLYNYDVCVWETCGGQALSEVTIKQSPDSDTNGWNADMVNFLSLASTSSPWMGRGGASGVGENTSYTYAGIFATAAHSGNASLNFGFRASLVHF